MTELGLKAAELQQKEPAAEATRLANRMLTAGFNHVLESLENQRSVSAAGARDLKARRQLAEKKAQKVADDAWLKVHGKRLPITATFSKELGDYYNNLAEPEHRIIGYKWDRDADRSSELWKREYHKAINRAFNDMEDEFSRTRFERTLARDRLNLDTVLGAVNAAAAVTKALK